MNIENTLNTAIKTLTQFNIQNANLDSEILLAKIIGKDRNYIILNSKEHLNQKYLFRFNNLIERRKKGEPVAYLTRKKEFWKNDFYVDQNVLVPRPDTELIVEEVLKFSKKKFKLQILDIGTGSGCILLSLLKEIPSFYGTGIDISKKSINVSKYNAKMLNLTNRVKFYNSDVDKFKIGKYDIVVSNPPYIELLKLKYLDKDLCKFEPKIALNGGIDGFSAIKKVVHETSFLIKRNGKFFLEIGYNQKNKVKAILTKKGFYINKVLKDYGNNYRCIISTKI